MKIHRTNPRQVTQYDEQYVCEYCHTIYDEELEAVCCEDACAEKACKHHNREIVPLIEEIAYVYLGTKYSLRLTINEYCRDCGANLGTTEIHQHNNLYSDSSEETLEWALLEKVMLRIHEEGIEYVEDAIKKYEGDNE